MRWRTRKKLPARPGTQGIEEKGAAASGPLPGCLRRSGVMREVYDRLPGAVDISARRPKATLLPRKFAFALSALGCPRLKIGKTGGLTGALAVERIRRSRRAPVQ